VIECDRLGVIRDQALVQDVEHLKERSLVGDFRDVVGLEATLILGALLTPDLEFEVFEGVAHL
jgi:hypothetical protein